MIVVDASVASKWFRRTDENNIDKALILLQNHINNKEAITIPSLLYLEVANAMVTKGGMGEKAIRKNLEFLNERDLKIYSFTKTDYIEAAVLANKFKTSVYDMLYAVIAKKNNTVLITADDKFIRKTKFPFVKSLSNY